MQTDDQPAEDRPESLPEQVRRVARDGYRRFEGVAAWWGLILLVAIAAVGVLISQLISHVAIASGNPTGPIAWLVAIAAPILMMAGHSVGGTILPYTGLWSGLATHSITKRLLIGIAVVSLSTGLSSLRDLPYIPYSILSAILVWFGWFAVAMLVRWRFRCVLSTSEPTEAIVATRWTIRDLLLLTTLVAVLAGISGIVLQALPSLDQTAGTVALPNWGITLLYALVNFVGIFAAFPLLYGLLPIHPEPIRVRRVLVGFVVTLLLYCIVSILSLMVVSLQAFNMTLSQLGMVYVLTFALDVFVYLAGLAAVSLWLRWWGYRLRRIPGS